MARRYFPINKILANSFALTPKFYYVYRIKFIETGHFYIGCTGDLAQRLNQHLDKMLEAKSDLGGNHLPLYEKAAEIFTEQFEKWMDTSRYVRKGLDVHVIALSDTRDYAMAIERLAIDHNKSNPLCLNVM